MSECFFKLKFVNPDNVTTKQVPLFVGGVESGQITIRRNTSTGLMDLEPYISPAAPNISNVYYFEKTVPSVDQDKFVTLIDVFVDSRDYTLPAGVTLQQYEALERPNNLSSPNYLTDLHRWKLHKSRKVLSRYHGTSIVSLAEFNSITSARMVPWTTTGFVCSTTPDLPVPTPPPLFDPYGPVQQ